MAYIQGESRGQTSLFPVSLEELIPEDLLVRVIVLYVAKFDMGQLGLEKTQPKATGRPAYGARSRRASPFSSCLLTSSFPLVAGSTTGKVAHCLLGWRGATDIEQTTYDVPAQGGKQVVGEEHEPHRQ